MPQMTSLNWLMFSFFSILLILFNVMDYHVLFNEATSLSPNKTPIKTLISKW